MANRSPGSSQYDSPEYDYTDSFASDEDDHPKRSPLKKTGPNKKMTKGRGRGQVRQTQSSQEFSDNITRKMMSAKKLKINELRNKIQELSTSVAQLREENKLLKKMQHRQEKALVRFEHEESDLPQLIQRHNNETRNLKEQLRRTRDKYERTDRYLRDAEDELDKVKGKLRKYKTLAEDKRLPERDELNKRLNKLELEAEEKDLKLRDLEKHVNHLNKNHRHELGIEMARNRETQKQLEQVREEKDKLQSQMREKEKELEVKNIYANRMLNQSRRIPASYGGTPNESPQPPRMRKRAPSLEATPRDKMKEYEQKRREESRKHREIIQKARNERVAKKTEKQTNFWTQDEDDLEQRRRDEEEKHKREIEDWENSVLQRRLQEEQEERTLQQERERIKRESDNRLERERKQREDQERERERERRFEYEQREKRERELKEKDREERERERLEFEKRKREEQEREDREREERERRRKKEMEEQERRAREERERLQFDRNAIDERRKKDEILAKLREIDEGQNKKPNTTNENPFFITNKSDSNASTPTSKKSYNFTRPIENMHQGLPSHEDITVPYLEKQKHKKVADVETGGYQPSYGSGKRGVTKDKPSFLFSENDSFSSKPRKDKKTNLLNDLFGSQENNTSKPMNGYDDIFSASSKKTQTQAQRSSFPWDEDSKLVQGKPHRENSSTVFAGGSALVDDEESPLDAAKLLPRRQRQSVTTFQSRPAVTAVDNTDDDIEEVIL